VKAEVGKARFMFTVTDRETIEGSFAVFLDREGTWVAQQATSIPRREFEGAWDAELDVPLSALPSCVDEVLKNMGWQRTSDLHSWPATEPVFPPSAVPNRATECSIRRGGHERRFLRAVDRAVQAERRENGLR
jgi:hypothetical protein